MNDMERDFNKFIEDRWVSISDNQIREDKTYKEYSKIERDLNRKLIDTLTDEQKEMFDEYQSSVNLVNSLELEIMYREGFKDSLRIEKILKVWSEE